MNIRLMADCDCFPLWVVSDEGSSNVDPADLDLSCELLVSLESWRRRYAATLNRDDPAVSEFL